MPKLTIKPKGFQLSYKDGKPLKFKPVLMKGATIKSEDLIKYASNVANVPVANIESCVQGLIEAIAYFVINGHRVVLPKVGGFYLGVKSKSATVSTDLDVKKALKAVRILFAPANGLREEMNNTSVEMIDAAVGVGNGGDGTGVTPTPTPTPGTLASPNISGVDNGNGTGTVTITATSGATIRYTVDGSGVSASSPTYDIPLTIQAGTTTIKAKAFKDGQESSESSRSVTVAAQGGGGTVALPTISYTPNNPHSGQPMTITMTAEQGAEIHYTLDGTTPTAESTKYTQPVTKTPVAGTLHIKAIAIVNGVSSAVKSENVEVASSGDD